MSYASMKYICVMNEDEEVEEIFVFPKWVNHDCSFNGIRGLKDQMHGNWNRVDRELISAGFVDNDLTCHGKSETLKIESRGDVDTKILKIQF